MEGRGGVALHPEGVDRNLVFDQKGYDVRYVALHPEGVDRNSDIDNIIFDEFVALHPEGVDRN